MLTRLRSAHPRRRALLGVALAAALAVPFGFHVLGVARAGDAPPAAAAASHDVLVLRGHEDAPITFGRIFAAGVDLDGSQGERVMAILSVAGVPEAEWRGFLQHHGIAFDEVGERFGFDGIVLQFENVASVTFADRRVSPVTPPEEQGDAQPRMRVSRVQSDMRSMAVALESFFVDFNRYPGWAYGRDPRSLAHGVAGFEDMPTLLRQHPTVEAERFTLTTPIAYMTSHFRDPFAQRSSVYETFAYYSISTPVKGWVLASPGPDGVFDADLTKYTGHQAADEEAFRDVTYDPTNGVVSRGDIFRFSQKW